MAELNSSSVGIYFAIRNNLILLLTTREIKDMSLNELKTLVAEVRYFADFWDDILIKEFS